MYFVPQSSVLAQQDLATALSTLPAARHSAWWTSWRALWDTGQQFDCWPTRHNTVLLIVFGRRPRCVSPHPLHSDARKGETERERNSQCICSLVGVFSSSAGCRNTCVLWSSHCWRHAKVFLCVVALRGTTTILDTEKLFLLCFWLFK